MRSSSWRSGQELEVPPGDRSPEAGGPGVRTSWLVVGRGFRGVLRCPRGVDKVRVTLPSLEVRVRKAFPSTPGTIEIIHCLFQKGSLVFQPMHKHALVSTIIL